MKKEVNKPRLMVKVYLDCGKSYVCDLVKKDPPFLGRMLADATATSLWRMVVIFRGTNLWDKFLRAVLRIPDKEWSQRKLRPWHARKHFKPKEIEQILDIYEGMGTDVKARAILFYLNYDQYWTKRVKKFAGEKKARLELEEASQGIKGCSIPPQATRASKECLAKLSAYVNSLKEKQSRK